jgi:hypothetical protein
MASQLRGERLWAGQVQFRGMAIHCRRGLGTAVAIRTVKIECCDAVLARNAFERNGAGYLFGRVVAHKLQCSPLSSQPCRTRDAGLLC